jgi:flavin reductase (DIM6/NTAB) family NADH-FMN oxidoreductase RutF
VRHQCGLGEYDASTERHCGRAVQSLGMGDIRLHQAPSTTVKPARVKEFVFSIEGRLTDLKEFEHHAKPGMSLASLAVIEATRFWVCEDAINDDLSQIDLSVLRPVA